MTVRIGRDFVLPAVEARLGSYPRSGPPHFLFAPSPRTFVTKRRRREMATANAGRATRGRRSLPRVPRALAARPSRGRPGRAGAKTSGRAMQPSSCA